MSKIVYIIPWLWQNWKMESFQEIWWYFDEKWIKPVYIDIDWKYKTISDYIEQFKAQMIDCDNYYILGFSFWAMIAFISSQTLKPKGIFICSLSPYFKEDLNHVKKWWLKYIWKNREKDFKTFIFENIAKNISCESVIFVWDKEDEVVLNRATEYINKVKNSKLIIVDKCAHDISKPQYLEVIKGMMIDLN